jgi:hypothetical protein
MGASLRLFNRTTPPASPGSGDVWYRSDTAEFHGSDGQAGPPVTLGPPGNVPVVRPSGWHAVPAYGNAAGLNVPNDRAFAVPFYPGRACTLTGVAFNVTTALIGGVVRLGIYTSDGVLPTSLLADYGTVTAGILGIQSVTGLTTPVRPALHFLIVCRQGGGLTMALSTRQTWSPYVADTSPVISSNLNAYYADGVSGALPASFGAPAGSVQGPCLTVQLA